MCRGEIEVTNTPKIRRRPFLPQILSESSSLTTGGVLRHWNAAKMTSRSRGVGAVVVVLSDMMMMTMAADE